MNNKRQYCHLITVYDDLIVCYILHICVFFLQELPSCWWAWPARCAVCQSSSCSTSCTAWSACSATWASSISASSVTACASVSTPSLSTHGSCYPPKFYKVHSTNQIYPGESIIWRHLPAPPPLPWIHTICLWRMCRCNRFVTRRRCEEIWKHNLISIGNNQLAGSLWSIHRPTQLYFYSLYPISPSDKALTALTLIFRILQRILQLLGLPVFFTGRWH